MLAFDEMCAALNELKTGRRCRKDPFADESNSFGIGVDGLAEALEPLRGVNRVADDRVVDPNSSCRYRLQRLVPDGHPCGSEPA